MDAHLHYTDFDFEVIVVEAAGDSGRLSYRFQFDRVSFRDMFDDLRLGVGVALIGSGGVGYHCSVELLAEFAAEFGDAAVGFFGKLLGGDAVLYGAYCFAGVIFKVAE